jgi:hypothetical protein
MNNIQTRLDTVINQIEQNQYNLKDSETIDNFIQQQNEILTQLRQFNENNTMLKIEEIIRKEYQTLLNTFGNEWRNFITQQHQNIINTIKSSNKATNKATININDIKKHNRDLVNQVLSVVRNESVEVKNDIKNFIRQNQETSLQQIEYEKEVKDKNNYVLQNILKSLNNLTQQLSDNTAYNQHIYTEFNNRFDTINRKFIDQEVNFIDIKDSSNNILTTLENNNILYTEQARTFQIEIEQQIKNLMENVKIVNRNFSNINQNITEEFNKSNSKLLNDFTTLLNSYKYTVEEQFVNLTKDIVTNNRRMMRDFINTSNIDFVNVLENVKTKIENFDNTLESINDRLLNIERFNNRMNNNLLMVGSQQNTNFENMDIQLQRIPTQTTNFQRINNELRFLNSRLDDFETQITNVLDNQRNMIQNITTKKQPKDLDEKDDSDEKISRIDVIESNIDEMEEFMKKLYKQEKTSEKKISKEIEEIRSIIQDTNNRIEQLPNIQNTLNELLRLSQLQSQTQDIPLTPSPIQSSKSSSPRRQSSPISSLVFDFTPRNPKP